MAFPDDDLDIEVSIALGADLTADPGTWSFTDITDFVEEQRKVGIRRGKTGAFAQVTASKCQMTVDNTDGRFSRHNPSGAWVGQIKKNTPLRVRIDNGSGYVNRFCGFVTGWPPQWDPSEADHKVELSADGIMRRLGRDGVLRSPMFRTISRSTPTPLAYWPLEDGIRSNVAASGLPGGTSMTGDIQFESTDGPDGSSSAVRLADRGVATGPIVGCGTANWRVEHAARWADTAAPAASSTSIEIATTGTVQTWRIAADDSPAVIRLGYLPAGASVYTFISSTETTFDGEWKHIRFDAAQDGADIDVTLTINGSVALSSTVSTHTLGAATSVGLATDEDVPDDEIPDVCQIAVWSGSLPTDDTAGAAEGFAGEQAHVRVERICQEEGFPVTITGDSSAAMGPQPIAKLLDVLRDCADADRGILYEPLDFGLAYICGRHLYNQAPAITLQYDQGHVSPPFRPDDDDRDFYNDVTAQRPDGAPMRYANTDSIAEVGSYPLPVRPNVETDDQAYQIAAWLATIGSNDELQWPAVRPNLVNAPSLIDAWLATDIGMNLSITGHPSPLAPEAIVQLVQGYTEVLGSRTFDPVVTLSPASVYNSVGVWGLVGKELHAAINTSVTSADIATTSGPLLATSLGAGGYTALINAEEIQVTAVAASLVTFGVAGTVTHANNANVTPGIPASVATGNLLLAFAAIRNSGTGVPNTPSGYTRLPVFGVADNCQLFAKIATSGAEAAPAISFTGGAANADTSAQMIRLAGKWHSTNNILLDSNTQLNASAQNINYPGLMTPMADDCIILYLGWKADDWTSVTGPGTEIGEPDTTTGDDQGIAWYYAIQTTATAIGPAAFVVTGGATAISRSATLALRCDYQTATITRSINGVSASHAAADAVTLADPSIWAL